MPGSNLPIGIQSFSEIRIHNYLYVDKTRYISSLYNTGKYYFLSRPRRFGKSLFIDTLDCAFSGRKDLFEGLYLTIPDSGWDFEKIYPVLRVDFAGGTIRKPEDLRERLDRLLDELEDRFQTRQTEGSPGERMLYLIPQIAEISKTQVVLLVDEYDKPILDNLEDLSVVVNLRDQLKDFYGAIKPLDVYIRFVFLTGVSKLSKTGIFSGLNNLKDITLDKRYSSICGYTEEDLLTVFRERVTSFDLKEISRWYNGYSWLGESVYNPFDILLFFDEGVFRPFWFETGTPSFLLKIWKADPRSPADYDGMVIGEEILGSFDPEQIRMETLLYQSGYLTIREWTADAVRGLSCIIGYPNIEVRTSLNILFSEALTGRNITYYRSSLYDLLETENISGLHDFFLRFFASIPHDWYRKNQIARFEGYYASVFYTCFASLGYQVIPEDTTNHGRIDLTVQTHNAIWIFEFKVLGPNLGIEKRPLDQIRMKGYAQKYYGTELPVYEIGVIFDPTIRNIVSWEVGR